MRVFFSLVYELQYISITKENKAAASHANSNKNEATSESLSKILKQLLVLLVRKKQLLRMMDIKENKKQIHYLLKEDVKERLL